MDGPYCLRTVSTATKATSFHGYPTHEERAEAAALFCDSNTEVHESVNGKYPLRMVLSLFRLSTMSPIHAEVRSRNLNRSTRKDSPFSHPPFLEFHGAFVCDQDPAGAYRT